MFRQAWSRRQFCLVPADAFYEPNWETGHAVRWRIEMASRAPFAIGGLWYGAHLYESRNSLTFSTH